MVYPYGPGSIHLFDMRIDMYSMRNVVRTHVGFKIQNFLQMLKSRERLQPFSNVFLKMFFLAVCE